MDRQVTSPTQGPPLPCKEALSLLKADPVTGEKNRGHKGVCDYCLESENYK